MLSAASTDCPGAGALPGQKPAAISSHSGAQGSLPACQPRAGPSPPLPPVPLMQLQIHRALQTRSCSAISGRVVGRYCPQPGQSGLWAIKPQPSPASRQSSCCFPDFPLCPRVISSSDCLPSPRLAAPLQSSQPAAGSSGAFRWAASTNLCCKGFLWSLSPLPPGSSNRAAGSQRQLTCV